MNVSFAPLKPDAVAFLTRATGVDFSRCDFANERAWFCITSRDDDGFVALVIVVEFKTDFDAHLSLAISDPRAATRRLMRAGYSAVFSRAKRITAMVDARNEDAARKALRMGFQYEGYVRLGIEGSRDALMFGMLPYDCPHLPQYVRPEVPGMMVIGTGEEEGRGEAALH